MKQTLTTSAALLVGLAALSNKPAVEEVDLSLRFQKGQTFTLGSTTGFDMALDELSVMVDGAEVLGDGIGFEMLMEATESRTIEVLEVADGEITALRITFDEMDGEIEASFDAMGEADSMNETIDAPTTGHTVEVRLDEDGEVVATDVTEDAAELLDDAVLAALDLNPMLDELLPTEPVAVGEEFELGEDWRELMEQAMDLGMAGAASELGETDIASMGAMMETIMDAVSFEATGKVTGVEDGMATIEYEITVSMEIDDLVGMAAEIAPEAGEIPPGVEASLLAGVELTGTGMFDLELGQLVSLELEGDMSMEMDGAADMQGTSAEAAAAMSGTTTTKMTVEVE